MCSAAVPRSERGSVKTGRENIGYPSLETMNTLPSLNRFNLAGYQLDVEEVHRNLPPSSLYERAIRYDKDASIAENGALVAYSGTKTGRSPNDKRVVRHPV